MDAGRSDDPNNYSAEIGEHISKVKKYRAEKRQLYDTLNEMKERSKILEAQRANFTKNIP